MSFSHQAAENWIGNGESLSGVQTYTGTGTFSIDENVATAETDYEIAMVLDVSETEMIYIHSDKDVTFEVNDNVGGGGSLALTADKPYLWTSDSYYTDLLAVDITSIFITNTSGSTARIRVECVYDATP